MWIIDFVQQIAILRYGYRVFVREDGESVLSKAIRPDW